MKTFISSFWTGADRERVLWMRGIRIQARDIETFRKGLTFEPVGENEREAAAQLKKTEILVVTREEKRGKQMDLEL